MALPNFFFKAALGATQLLRGVDDTRLADILNRTRIGVLFDAAAAASPEGRATLELSINLLARLYPRLAVVPYGPATDLFAERLSAEAHAINPEIEIVADPHALDATLIVGAPPVSVSGRTVYVGSQGWLARLSPTTPVPVGQSDNPFGAGAAACFGAANIFRIVFGDMLSGGVPDKAFTLSLFDYAKDSLLPVSPPLGALNIGETHLVGLGAIGNGAIWALSRLAGLRGVLHLVDGEAVDLSNLQRYVLAQQGDIDAVKVELAAKALKGTRLTVRPHAQRWGHYLRERDTWQWERVAVALDTAEDRRAVQAALPRWIANAWTRAENLGVSRHWFVDEQACLTCLYFPEKTAKSESQAVAESLGLPPDDMDVRALLSLGRPIRREFIERVAAAKRVPLEPLLTLEGQSLRSFYGRAVCGRLLVQLGAEDAGPVAEVPMAFQSALAGVMLAAEILAHAEGRRPQEHPATTRLNLLRPLSSYLNFPEGKEGSGRCICRDPIYVARYQEKYATSVPRLTPLVQGGTERRSA